MMKTTPSQSRVPPARRQSGSSLLEVLISVFILAFGLLGIVGMQIASLRGAQSSLERSQAVFLTHTILDAMRANMHNPHAADDLSDLRVKTGYVTGGLKTAADYANVDPTDLPGNDLLWWLKYVEKDLGQDAKGQVECADNECTVTIQWNDSRGAVDKTAEDVSTLTVKNRSIL